MEKTFITFVIGAIVGFLVNQLFFKKTETTSESSNENISDNVGGLLRFAPVTASDISPESQETPKVFAVEIKVISRKNSKGRRREQLARLLEQYGTPQNAYDLAVELSGLDQPTTETVADYYGLPVWKVNTAKSGFTSIEVINQHLRASEATPQATEPTTETAPTVDEKAERRANLVTLLQDNGTPDTAYAIASEDSGCVTNEAIAEFYGVPTYEVNIASQGQTPIETIIRYLQ